MIPSKRKALQSLLLAYITGIITIKLTKHNCTQLFGSQYHFKFSSSLEATFKVVLKCFLKGCGHDHKKCLFISEFCLKCVLPPHKSKLNQAIQHLYGQRGELQIQSGEFL